MTIVQPNIYVPPAIELGLHLGKYVREGSVVRDAVSKQIVNLLKEVPDAAEMLETAASATARLKWMPGKPAIIITAVVVSAAAATGVIAHKVKKHAERNMVSSESVRKFGVSWDKYQEAIRDQRLDAEILDQLISDFEALVQCSPEDRTSPLALSAEHGASLANFVANYSDKLAKANNLDLADLQEKERQQVPIQDSGDSVVVDLRRNLTVQRKIFGDAA